MTNETRDWYRSHDTRIVCVDVLVKNLYTSIYIYLYVRVLYWSTNQHQSIYNTNTNDNNNNNKNQASGWMSIHSILVLVCWDVVESSVHIYICSSCRTDLFTVTPTLYTWTNGDGLGGNQTKKNKNKRKKTRSFRYGARVPRFLHP